MREYGVLYAKCDGMEAQLSPDQPCPMPTGVPDHSDGIPVQGVGALDSLPPEYLKLAKQTGQVK